MDTETVLRRSIAGFLRDAASNGDEIGVSKPFRVVEDRNHLWQQAVDSDFLGFRYRKCRIFGVSRAKQPHGLREFARIGDWLRLGCHRKTRDRHWVRDIVINRQGHSAIPRQIRRFLALWAAQEVDRQAIVDITDCGRLRPPVRPVRRL
jgi:hypothetical protein